MVCPPNGTAAPNEFQRRVPTKPWEAVCVLRVFQSALCRFMHRGCASPVFLKFRLFGGGVRHRALPRIRSLRKQHYVPVGGRNIDAKHRSDATYSVPGMFRRIQDINKLPPARHTILDVHAQIFTNDHETVPNTVLFTLITQDTN